MKFQQNSTIAYSFKEVPYTKEQIENTVLEILSETLSEEYDKTSIVFNKDILYIDLKETTNLKGKYDSLNSYMLGTFEEYITKYILMGIGNSILPVVESGCKVA